ncbi:transcription antitermination factor NusB, partial [Lactobacillus crispatus]|uniref:transcription antitermination factor NusB n=1 Tax=Lactobacillus crispatus TaxID=47770 RepID=UPI002545F4C0
MNQHESRKVAMQAVYLANQEPDLTAEEVEAKVVATLNLKQLSAYSKKLIEGVLEDRKKLQYELTSHLKKGWRLQRVSQTVVANM